MYARGSEANTHVVAVVTLYVMGQFMTQHSLNVPATLEPVVHIGTDAEVSGLARLTFRLNNPGSSCEASLSTVQWRTCVDSGGVGTGGVLKVVCCGNGS
jgi:hypothetical protein